MMLHVDVYVPALDVSYEFSLNEHAKVSMLIDEMTHIISQKEQKVWEGNVEELLLCSLSSARPLPMEQSLYQCKVCPGSRLLLL